MTHASTSTISSGNEPAVISLNRKLLRDLWRLKGQMASIALVVATGIMTVVTMRGSYETLVDAQQAYFQDTRFAEIWAPLKRAPNELRKKIELLPGVAGVDTRIGCLVHASATATRTRSPAICSATSSMPRRKSA